MNNFLNIDIPEFDALIRKEFLYDQRRGHGKYEEVEVFGLASIEGRAIGFHCLTRKGAQLARIPIHALCWKPCARQPLDHLELWDCFSYYPSAHEFHTLSGLRVRAWLKDRKCYWGRYMFTIDWAKSPNAESVGEGGHKNAHVIKLDNGNFAALPNNRLFWHEASFITQPFKKFPDYITNTRVWECEGAAKWTTTDTDKTYYDVKELK